MSRVREEARAPLLVQVAPRLVAALLVVALAAASRFGELALAVVLLGVQALAAFAPRPWEERAFVVRPDKALPVVTAGAVTLATTLAPSVLDGAAGHVRVAGSGSLAGAGVGLGVLVIVSFVTRLSRPVAGTVPALADTLLCGVLAVLACGWLAAAGSRPAPLVVGAVLCVVVLVLGRRGYVAFWLVTAAALAGVVVAASEGLPVALGAGALAAVAASARLGVAAGERWGALPPGRWAIGCVLPVALSGPVVFAVSVVGLV
ncbi:hypothetical protein CLV56_1365 [Mumia flava]|uniref:Uncharacterized protein n=1 Tax=Mumia flava TaxID=1348852 RepID=A0A0B2BTZ7_9ACTN|nr:hypothetical protein [Mumia flava]PJJ57144.1 hypothetical protein CLV56_1365 [Mumia flava]